MSRETHIEHCCAEHGCKYGDAACPVEADVQLQRYPCEVCESMKDDGLAPQFSLRDYRTRTQIDPSVIAHALDLPRDFALVGKAAGTMFAVDELVAFHNGVERRHWWNEAQIATFCRHFRQKWKAAWPVLAEPLRHALVDQVVLEIIQGQALGAVPTKAIDQLRAAMHRHLLEEQWPKV